MDIQLNTELPRRALRATWSVESMDDLLNAHGVSRKDEHLRSTYKGKKKTVKQRNKYVTSFFIGKQNRRILENRNRIRTQKTLINRMADQIRKEVDREVLKNILNMFKHGLPV